MYPGITIAPAMFKGSGEVAHTEATTQQFSVVASADTTTIPSVLFPNYTNYEIAFGITQMVIIVNLNTTPARRSINYGSRLSHTHQCLRSITRPGKRFGK